MDVDPAAFVVVGSGGDHGRSIGRIGHSSIRIRAEKKGGIRDKTVDREPYVELSGDEKAAVYADTPDPRSGILKTHKDQLASGSNLCIYIIYSDHSLFQKKGDPVVILEGKGDPGDIFSSGRDKADGI